MSGLTKAIALGSTLGLGYVALKYHESRRPRTPTTANSGDTPAERSPSLAEAARDPRTPTTSPTTGHPEPGGVMGPFKTLSQMLANGTPGPIPEPPRPRRLLPLNRSTTDDTLTVVQTPTELLAQAQKHDPAITLDELTGARLAASEHYSGSFTELCCIVDSEVNRAERKGKSLYKSLTYRDTFGKQGKQRRASTRRDPNQRHLLAARAVLSGQARGISQGAVQFFDPEAMDRLNRKVRLWREGKLAEKPSHAPSCDALGLLEAWSYDYPKKSENGPRCPPDRSRSGHYTLAWVGPIAGVDPYYLMLMKRLPLGPEHTQRYQAARQLIIDRKAKQS